MDNLKYAYPLKEPICIRELKIVNSEERIIIKLWQPYYLINERTWSCGFQIDISNKEPHTSFFLGTDSFQALIMTLKAIQVYLDSVVKIYDSGIEFSNFDIVNPASHGFPFFQPEIPSFKYDRDGNLK